MKHEILKEALTAEQEDKNTPEYVIKRIARAAGAEQPYSEGEIDHIAKEWASQDRTKRMAEEINSLEALYADRSIYNNNFHFGDSMHNTITFATRHQNGRQIAELMTHTTEWELRAQPFGSWKKPKNTYSVTVFDDNGHEDYRMLFSDNVYDFARIRIAGTERMTQELIDDKVFDWFYRSLIAAQQVSERDEYERGVADKIALELIRERQQKQINGAATSSLGARALRQASRWYPMDLGVGWFGE